jgi:hypothetical protein
MPATPDMETRLLDACAVVSQALDLPADGVIATHVATQMTVRPGHPATRWPVVVVHGSARDRVLMDRALDALTELSRSWTPGGESWVSWQAPQ